jgi:hypothetical protein
MVQAVVGPRLIQVGHNLSGHLPPPIPHVLVAHVCDRSGTLAGQKHDLKRSGFNRMDLIERDSTGT